MRRNESLVAPYDEFFQVINTHVIDNIDSEERQKEVSAACTKAWGFLQRESTHLVRKFEFDPQNGQDVERFLLLSAMLDAADAYEGKGKTWVLRKVSLLLDSLFTRNVKRHTERVGDEYGLDTRVLAYLILSAFPVVRMLFGYKNAESFLQASGDQARSQMFRIISQARSIFGVDGIVVLDLPKESYIALQQQAFEAFGIPKDKQVVSMGTGAGEIGAFMFGSTSKSTLIHERNHMQNPGMRLGALGSVLDEGMTELLTHEELHRKRKEVFYFHRREDVSWKEERTAEMDTAYDPECKLLVELMDLDPRLASLLEGRYRSSATQDAGELSAVLLEKLGMPGYLTLYLTNPGVKRGEKRRRDSAALSTEEMLNRLNVSEQIRE